MHKLIDEWGKKVFPASRPRKGRNLYSGSSHSPKSTKASGGYKAKFVQLSQRSPEVMVKISGSGKNIGQVKAHLDYIARNGDVELEDERGEVYRGKDDINELRDMWDQSGYKIPTSGKAKRETFNIVLSMPPGTDRPSVKNAARAFAKDQFPNHQYAFAAHDDEEHPHVHLAVKAVSLRGVRLNPRKADLQNYRESFADHLRDNGVAANATRRFARGRIRKSEKQPVLHINRRNESYIAKSRAKRNHINPHVNKIIDTRRRVIEAIGDTAREMAKSNELSDNLVAKELVNVVKNMDGLNNVHQVNKMDRNRSNQLDQTKGKLPVNKSNKDKER